jgi:pyruvate dehydrogenase E2 component (dihydrolipoamide acetyltransferase)
VIRDRMKVTMSCDHRVVDGAIGAEYLKTLRQYLEQPLRIVI